jgi:hypothetical protein
MEGKREAVHMSATAPSIVGHVQSSTFTKSVRKVLKESAFGKVALGVTKSRAQVASPPY